jgi:hypothetical protein
MHPFLINDLSRQHQEHLRSEAKATHGCVVEWPVRSMDEQPEPDQWNCWKPKVCPQ